MKVVSPTDETDGGDTDTVVVFDDVAGGLNDNAKETHGLHADVIEYDVSFKARVVNIVVTRQLPFILPMDEIIGLIVVYVFRQLNPFP